jgi:hypothetical protein
VRPNRFRLEWNAEPPDWTSNLPSYFEKMGSFLPDWIVSKYFQKDPFTLFAAASIATHGAPFKIPVLLMPEVNPHPNSIVNISEPVLIAAETLDNRECFRIVASVCRENDHTFWISVEDFSIRRIREAGTVNPTELEKMFERMLLDNRFRQYFQSLNIDLDKIKALPKRDKSYWSEYTYSDVQFDHTIDPTSFENTESSIHFGFNEYDACGK